MASHPFTFEKTDLLFGARNVPLIKVQPPGYLLSEPYQDLLPEIYNMEVRESDVWLVGLYKCGTTWATELIYCVHHEGDLTEANSKYPLEKWIFLETPAIFKISNYNNKEGFKEVMSKAPEYATRINPKTIAEAKSPRFIRTHLALSLLPPKLLDTCKVVYVCRNFKDMWISMHHMISGGPFQTQPTLEEYVENFFEDKAATSPIWKNLREAWEKREHKNIYFLLYEDMKKDLKGVIRKIATFLNKELTKEKIDIIAEHLSFENMKSNKYTNMQDLQKMQWLPEGTTFMRKGTAGQWKTIFNEDLKQKYKAWWQKNMGDTDFNFPDDN